MDDRTPSKQKRIITVGSPPRKRIIYEDDEGKEYYVKSVRGKPQMFYLHEEFITANSELDPDKLISELSGINTELININQDAKRFSKGMPGSKLETTRLRILTLRHRSELLVKLLNKSLPDKRTLEHSGKVEMSNTVDSIPDEVLVAAMLGKLSEKQMKQMELLMVEGVGGEH